MFKLHAWRHSGRANLCCMQQKVLHNYTTQRGCMGGVGARKFPFFVWRHLWNEHTRREARSSWGFRSLCSSTIIRLPEKQLIWHSKQQNVKFENRANLPRCKTCPLSKPYVQHLDTKPFTLILISKSSRVRCTMLKIKICVKQKSLREITLSSWFIVK